MLHAVNQWRITIAHLRQFTYLKVKSARSALFTSGGLGLGLVIFGLGIGLVFVTSGHGLGLVILAWSCKQRSWSCYFGLGLKNFVLFTSLAWTGVDIHPTFARQCSWD